MHFSDNFRAVQSHASPFSLDVSRHNFHEGALKSELTRLKSGIQVVLAGDCFFALFWHFSAMVAQGPGLDHFG